MQEIGQQDVEYIDNEAFYILNAANAAYRGAVQNSVKCLLPRGEIKAIYLRAYKTPRACTVPHRQEGQKARGNLRLLARSRFAERSSSPFPRWCQKVTRKRGVVLLNTRNGSLVFLIITLHLWVHRCISPRRRSRISWKRSTMAPDKSKSDSKQPGKENDPLKF